MRQLARRESEPQSLLDSLMRRLRELAGRGEAEGGGLRESIEELIEAPQEDGAGRLSAAQRTLLLNALAFGELRVDDVMIARAEIDAVPLTASLADVIAAMREAEHSRLVAYRETLDDVVGVVEIKDLLAYWDDAPGFSVEKLARPPLVVPPSMQVIDLILEMRDTGMHLAVVVDEFGGTDGVVGIEDLVAELLGELHERGDGPDPGEFVVLPDGEVDVDARIGLEELERHLGVTLVSEDDRDDADTLGGAMVLLADRVPQPGEVIEHPSGLKLEVVDGDARRLRRVRISGLPHHPATIGEPPARDA